MRLIDKYLKLARQCRETSRNIEHEDVRRRYAELADDWEAMAQERLRLLQLQTAILGPPGTDRE